MNEDVTELLAAARPWQFRPGSTVDPATRERELAAAFSAPVRAGAHRRRPRKTRPDRPPVKLIAATLSAALSIVLIATGLWLAHSSSPTHRPPEPSTSKHPTKKKPVHPATRNLLSAPVAKPPPPARAQKGMPPYYVIADHNGPAIEVHSSTTGELLSQAPLPANVDPKLTEIANGPDGRFVLAFFTIPKIEFYLLKVTDQGRSAQLSPMSVPPIKGHKAVTALALSPDGSKLAVGLQLPNQQATIVHGAIEVVTLAAGATRTWTSTHQGYPVQLSWTDRGRNLGFYWTDQEETGRSATAGLWKLDPAAPGRDLFSGRRVLPETVGLDVVESAAFSADGKSVDASVVRLTISPVRRGEVISGIVRLSAQTGRPLSTLLVRRAPHDSKYASRTYSEGDCQLLAADPAADHLLVNCASQFARLDRARLTPLPNPDPGVFLTVSW